MHASCIGLVASILKSALGVSAENAFDLLGERFVCPLARSRRRDFNIDERRGDGKRRK